MPVFEYVLILLVAICLSNVVNSFIFYVSLRSDKKTVWGQRKPILNMGIMLVIVTVVAMGYLMHLLL